jgi:MFS family permease
MRRYLLAAFVARLADAMWLAPVLLVLDRTGSAGRAGLVLSAATLPSLVTAPLIGAWLDSHPRRRLAIAVHLVVLAGGLGALLAGLPAIACAFVAGLLNPLVTGGFSSVVPALGEGARGSALDSMTYNVAAVAGPALAGAMTFAGPQTAVGLQAVIALLGIPLTLSLGASADGVVSQARLWPAMRAGIGHLTRVGPLRSVTLMTSLGEVGWGMLSVVAPVLAVAFGAERGTAGLILAAVAIGALAGAALLPRLRAGLFALIVAGLLGQGAGLGLLALAPSLAFGLAAAALAGAANGLTVATMFTARARWSPAHLHAQVFTSAAGLRTGLYALGAALAGPAIAAGPRAATGLAAAALIAAAGAGSRPGSDRPPASRAVNP